MATEPTRDGRSFTNPAASTTSIILDPSTFTGSAIATGDWVVAFIAMTSTTTTITPPSGWTQIMAPVATGTEFSGVWAKIRQAGDSTYTFTLNAAGTTGGGALFWGSGPDPTIGNWIIGATTTRAASGGTTVNNAASVTTTQANTLVLTLSTERTTIATGAATYSGATSWFQMAESGSQIQTIDVGFIDMPTPGASGLATITYPTTQALNGIALQLAIPPIPGLSVSASGTTTGTGVTTAAVTANASATATTTGTGTATGNVAGTASATATTTTTGTAAAAVTKFATATGVTTTTGTAATQTPVQVFLALAFLNVAHRGFDIDYPDEETLHAYTGAAAWNRSQALEISANPSSDATPVWVNNHDTTTGRVFSGTNYTINSTPWATMSGLTSITGGYPITTADAILDAFPTRVFFVDNKPVLSVSAFLDMCDAHGGPARIIVKGYAGSTGYADLAHARGYKTWGYFYHADVPNISTWGTHWDLLGMELAAGTGTDWSTIVAVGKPVLAHTTPTTTTDRTSAISLGAVGVMASSGLQGAVPTDGATANGTTTTTGTATASVTKFATTAGTTTTAGTATATTTISVTATGVTTATATAVAAVTKFASSSATTTVTGTATATTSAVVIAAGTTTTTATASASLTLFATANGTTAVTGTASAHLPAVAIAITMTVGFASAIINGAFRDITVTASIGTRRWGAEIDEQHPTGAIGAQRWKGTTQ